MADTARKPRKGDPDYVGRGHPPKAHQFKSGGPSPNPRGRPPGSRNRSDIEKLLDQKVMAGHDERGRPIKRKLRDLMDRALVQAAIKGDLGAIRIIKEYEFKHAQLRRAEEPDAETLRAQKEEEEQKKVLSERLVNELTLISTLKHLGIVETGGDGRLTIAPWAQEASQAHNRSPSGEGGG